MGIKGFTDKGHHIFGFLEIVRFPFRFDGDPFPRTGLICCLRMERQGQTGFFFCQLTFTLELADEPVYQFLDKKRAEGKPYFVYMTAAQNKFLRIYYARVKECLEAFDERQAASSVGSSLAFHN